MAIPGLGNRHHPNDSSANTRHAPITTTVKRSFLAGKASQRSTRAVEIRVANPFI
jgi:hypothetical protein